ncbi:hypothetical protein ABID21_002007 [Pseudorhizobium tarimense]|uniref:Uncharacterized protein n=1 Tax=Pseudorhizobium tarimense TaxID=1079109 RepID=A0ABV2H6J6_9HYPH|nr:hypothetical protein [Pseudorhizobium tarimense]MCJ8519267.1 hypothetical protein [Pseudorhizobium tarimense]
MIWISKKLATAPEGGPATGTYADGLFPALAVRELTNSQGRTFRHSYGEDYALARKRELPQVELR